MSQPFLDLLTYPRIPRTLETDFCNTFARMECDDDLQFDGKKA